MRGVVAFADPFPRRTLDGRTVVPGHLGTVYQALNFAYRGRSTPRTLTLLPDGTVFHERAAQKIRSQQRGHLYAEALLCELGAPAVDTVDPAAWLAIALTHIGARRIHHPGNHRYTITLGHRRAGDLAVTRQRRRS